MRDFYTTYTLLSHFLKFFFRLFRAQKTHHWMMLHRQFGTRVLAQGCDYQINKSSRQTHGRHAIAALCIAYACARTLLGRSKRTTRLLVRESAKA